MGVDGLNGNGTVRVGGWGCSHLASYPCAGPPLNLPAWKKAWKIWLMYLQIIPIL
jgi:hypothetical protein